MKRPIAARFASAPPRSVLVVTTQRLGDVLLATPLLRSLRRAWPQANLSALVFDDTRSVLERNRDIDEIITVPRRPSRPAHLRLMRSLWRRYDLAVSTGAGDRPSLYAWMAGRRSVGFVLPGAGQAWKRHLLDACVAFDDIDSHTVVANLRLADALGIARCYDVCLDWSDGDAKGVDQALGDDPPPYAVLHMSAKFNYKNWHAEGWARLGAWLIEQGMHIVFTGSPEPSERAAIAGVRGCLPAAASCAMTDFSLSQVAYLLSRAQLVISPDTVISHAAAAVGTPTITLFGPSNPIKWGPWPGGVQTDPSPYRLRGSQRIGNVFLLQGEGACVPCRLEGCDRHTASFSRCLQTLPAERVIEAARLMLGAQARTDVTNPGTAPSGEQATPPAPQPELISGAVCPT